MAPPTSSDPTAYLISLFGLVGRTALVTGGTRGIGAHLSVALASAGADIILLQRSPNADSATRTAVEALGRRCDSYICDLGDRAAVTGIVDQICVKDGREVDILVNCAGLQHRAAAVEFDTQKWDEILNVNLTAPFLLSRALMAHWTSTTLSTPKENQPKKKIINVASVLTFTGSTRVVAYASSKGGIGQLTKALSNEWMPRGVCVNALAPGYVITELTEGIRADPKAEEVLMTRVPAGRWGTGRDLEGAVVYLASGASDFVSGEIHVVDGGFCGR